MKTINLNTKITDAIAWLNESCLQLKGRKFKDYTEFHSLIHDCISENIIFEDKLVSKTWGISVADNYDFYIFNYAKNIIEDKRSRLRLKGKIIDVIFSIDEKQYYVSSWSEDNITLNNPITVNDLIRDHSISRLKKDINSNENEIRGSRVSIIELENRNVILREKLNIFLSQLK